MLPHHVTIQCLGNTLFWVLFSDKMSQCFREKKIQRSQILLHMVKLQYQLKAYVLCTFDIIHCSSNCKYRATEFFQKNSMFSQFVETSFFTLFLCVIYHMVCYFINLKHKPTSKNSKVTAKSLWSVIQHNECFMCKKLY